MERKLLGVIDATTYHEDLDQLIHHRSLAALPFAGRYRLIDFILSNMVNSGIQSVAIFPKAQYRSLMDHLESGKNWDLDRKRDGLFFFPSPLLEKSGEGVGSFNHFAANMDYFYRSTQEYLIIANCFTVCNIDFRKVLDFHIQAGCDITDISMSGKSLQMYLVKTSLLIHLIENRDITNYTCMDDVILDINNPYSVCHYEYEDYAEIINSIRSYYDISMNLLETNTWKSLFLKDRPIYTKVKDEPPTRYVNGSKVHKAMIANGCQIEGHVENSIVSRGVKIGKGSKIKNCIIMQKCHIEENCVLESVILDKDVRVKSGTVVSRSSEEPYVVGKGTVLQGAVIKS